MQIQRTFWLLAIAASLTGCRSNAGAGWAVWNPFSAWGKESAVASTDPTLPSQKFAATDKSAAPAGKTTVASATPAAGRAATSAPAYTPPAAVARTAAATPTMPGYSATATPSTPSTPAYSPLTPSATMPAAPMSNSLANGTGMATNSPTGPYNPNGYQPAAPAVTAESAAATNRYGMPDRYASSTPSTTPMTPSGPPVTSPTPSYPGADRYATYETPAPSSAAALGATAAPPQQVAPASATVNLTNPPGQYRPAGTSSYPMTSAGQVNVASLPEKPAATPPATSTPTGTTGYPSTGAPAPGSVYGVPSYR